MAGSYMIGIDVGGSKVAYGLFDGQGNLAERMQHPSEPEMDGPALCDQIIRTVRELLSRQNLSLKDLDGVGIGMPSHVLFDEGYIYMTPTLTNIRDFAMRDYLKERLDVPFFLDNDSNLAALAEYRRGAGRGCRHMVFIAMSTGIGSGLIINGNLFRGSYGLAGECGHMLITPDEGVRCGCRNQGCFVSYAGGRFIADHLKLRLQEGAKSKMEYRPDFSSVDLLQAYQQGDALADEMIQDIAHYLGVLLYNIYQALNINVYVLGGGLTNYGPVLLDRIRAEFDKYNQVPLPVEFRLAELKEDFGIIGACELVRTENNLTGRTEDAFKNCARKIEE